MKEHKKDLLWLNDMRFLAALAIIFVHIAQPFFSTEETLHSSSWWISNFYLSLNMWGVPVFVMISGALLLSPERQYNSLTDFYNRRLSRLFLPILFWTLIYLVLLYIRNITLGEPTTLSYFLLSLIKGQPYYHMWYLYMVWGLYLVTPFLRIIVKHASRSDLIFFASLLMMLSIIASQFTNPHDQKFFLLMFPFYLGYFVTGYIISTTKFNMRSIQIVGILSLLLILTILGEYYFLGHFVHNFSPTMILFAILLMILIKSHHYKIPIDPTKRQKLASFSLGAYLIHPALLAIFRKFNYFGIPMQEYLFITIPLLVIIITTISLLIAYIFSKLPFLKKTI